MVIVYKANILLRILMRCGNGYYT